MSNLVQPLSLVALALALIGVYAALSIVGSPTGPIDEALLITVGAVAGATVPRRGI